MYFRRLKSPKYQQILCLFFPTLITIRQPFRIISLLSFAALRLGTTGTESPEWQKEKKHNLPLRSAAPPLMIRATITAPVASSRLMVAPWSTGGRVWSLTAESKGLVPFFSSPLSSVTTHQRLLVLHQPDNLHRLFLQLLLEVVRQRRQHGVKVLLSHGVVHRENGLMGQKTDVLRLQCWRWAVGLPEWDEEMKLQS